MKNIVFLLAFALLCICTNSASADLLDCNDKILPSLSDVPIIGKESDEQKVGNFFKNVGCGLKDGAEKVSGQAKELGSELKEGAKNLGDKAKDLGSFIKDRFDDLF